SCRLQLSPRAAAPPRRSASVVWPCKPLSVLSPGPQCARGTGPVHGVWSFGAALLVAPRHRSSPVAHAIDRSIRTRWRPTRFVCMDSFLLGGRHVRRLVADIVCCASPASRRQRPHARTNARDCQHLQIDDGNVVRTLDTKAEREEPCLNATTAS